MVNEKAERVKEIQRKGRGRDRFGRSDKQTEDRQTDILIWASIA